MHRRRVLALLSATTAGVAGCGSFDDGSSRTPYDPPAETVDPSADTAAEADSDRSAEEPVTPTAIRSRLTTTSRYDVPCPIDESATGTCYHEVGPGTEAYLAPLSEHVAPTADGLTFVAFNRAAADLRLEADRCTVHRWVDGGWRRTGDGIEVDASTDAIEASDRRPAVLRLPFPGGEPGNGGRLPTGAYALGLSVAFDRTDSPERRLVAVFSVEPAEALREDGALLEPVRVVNDRPTGDGHGMVSAELRRPATTAHPAIVRVRLRSFRRVSVQGSIRLYGTTVGRNGDGRSRLELAGTTTFRDGCWRTTTDRTDVSLVTNTLAHGDEIAADFELGTPEGSCPSGGSYRFDDVFRLRGTKLETGFTVDYGTE